MAYCLKTQLKGSVDNSNLPFFEAMEFQVGVSHTCYFCPVNGKTITVFGPNGVIQTLSEEGYVQLEPNIRYSVFPYLNISGLSFFYADMPSTPVQLVYCKNIVALDYGGKLDGMYMPDTSSMEEIELGTTTILNGDYFTAWLKRQSVLPKATYNIYGYHISTTDLAELVSNTNNLVYQMSTFIAGRIEDYVIKRKTYFSTGSANFRYLRTGTNISFNGNAIAVSSTNIDVGVSWVPNSGNPAYTDITVGGTTITVDEHGDPV